MKKLNLILLFALSIVLVLCTPINPEPEPVNPEIG